MIQAQLRFGKLLFLFAVIPEAARSPVHGRPGAKPRVRLVMKTRNHNDLLGEFSSHIPGQAMNVGSHDDGVEFAVSAPQLLDQPGRMNGVL